MRRPDHCLRPSHWCLSGKVPNFVWGISPQTYVLVLIRSVSLAGSDNSRQFVLYSNTVRMQLIKPRFELDEQYQRDERWERNSGQQIGDLLHEEPVTPRSRA